MIKNPIFFLLIILGFGLIGGLFLFLKSNDFSIVGLFKLEEEIVLKNGDIGLQKPLKNPPEIIKGIYATNWSAGSEKKLSYLIDLIKKTELNSIIIDIKDFSGYIGYETEIDLVNKYNASEKRILKPNTLIKRLHDEGIYTIGRISVFEDQQLAKARPDLALKNKLTGELWKDDKKLFWLDPASKEVWDYNITIAKDAAARGFDEINFDYIRFASDGKVENISYPFWDNITPRQEIIRRFFEYLRREMEDTKISADIFGVTLVMNDDQNIGQYFENVLPYFDTVAPMVYPSHYSSGFFNFKNPAANPYEMVKRTLEAAVGRIKNYESGIMNATNTPITNYQLPITKLRPWLQDFDLGATYDANKIRAQIKAVSDALCNASSTDNNIKNCDYLGGFMLWDPANNYTVDALFAN